MTPPSMFVTALASILLIHQADLLPLSGQVSHSSTSLTKFGTNTETTSDETNPKETEMNINLAMARTEKTMPQETNKVNLEAIADVANLDKSSLEETNPDVATLMRKTRSSPTLAPILLPPTWSMDMSSFLGRLRASERESDWPTMGPLTLAPHWHLASLHVKPITVGPWVWVRR